MYFYPSVIAVGLLDLSLLYLKCEQQFLDSVVYLKLLLRLVTGSEPEILFHIQSILPHSSLEGNKCFQRRPWRMSKI